MEKMLKWVNQRLHAVGLDMHWQNLDERPGDRIVEHEASGSLLREGRLWVREHGGSYDERLALEWHLSPKMPGFFLQLGGMEPDLTVHLCGPVGSAYVTVPFGYERAELFQKLAGVERYERLAVASLRFHHGSLWWKVMSSVDSWSSQTPRWRDGSFSFRDAILGDSRYESERLKGPEDIVIPMPEGSYRWRVSFERVTRRRRFLPNEEFVRFNAECHEGHQIPIPGKGENAWDCGPDAIFSTSAPGRSVSDAIGHVVASALRDRMRRGYDPVYAEGGIHDTKKAG